MSKKIKVAIVGVGNCAKSLVEGIAFYTKNDDNSVGLMHPTIGDFLVRDIEIVAAFDVDKRKVGKPLHEAIQSEPNHTVRICEALHSDVIVQRGPSHDSVINELRDFYILESELNPVDVTKTLIKSGAEIVLNYLPTGSNKATYAYANCALEAGCHFINCMPTPIGKDKQWRKKFERKGLVLMGDDIKSQCGATIVNRVLLNLLKMRGIKVAKSEQVNFGGNSDHYNLHFRPETKEQSKESSLLSVLSQEDTQPSARMVFTKENYDHKQADIRIEGLIFGNIPVKIELKLEDEDSPNSSGVVVDAIRIVYLLSKTRSTSVSVVNQATAWLMKSPPVQLSEEKALEHFNMVINLCKQKSHLKKLQFTKSGNIKT